MPGSVLSISLLHFFFHRAPEISNYYILCFRDKDVSVQEH